MVTLLEAGTKVRIFPEKVNDRLPGELAELLRQDPYGIFLGYKITDGKGVGMVLKLRDGSKSWFFDNELDVQPSQHADLPSISHKNESMNRNPQKDGDSILELLNPFYFLEWLTYSLKDIF